jgi:hypothetical protein
MFTFADDTFDHTQLISFDKSTLLDGNPSTVTFFSTDRPEFTIIPATMYDAPADGPMYLITEAEFATPTARVLRMGNVLSDTPTFTVTDIPVDSYTSPPPGIQPGSAGELLDTNDTRYLKAEWRNNRLVATHNVGIGNAAKVRWYEFSTAGTPRLLQQGNINPGPGVFTWMPSISIAPNGSIGLVYMQSSASEFMSMYITGRGRLDPRGRMQTPVLVKAGVTTYVDFSPIPHRTGDYSGIGVDPATGKFWAASEFANTDADANWGTWIAEFSVTGEGQVVRVFNALRYTVGVTTTGLIRFRGDLTVATNSPGGVVGPFTLVFRKLPAGVTLVNAQGVTEEGHPFITVPVSVLKRGKPVKVKVKFANPNFVSLGTYYQPNFKIDIV